MLDIDSTVKLNSGYEMPLFGLGVFKMDDAACAQAVRTALDLGYRLIDTAAVYGNERGVGKGVKDSGIPREQLFITSKVWITDFGREATAKAFEVSMDKLGLDYLDLYLIHWPIREGTEEAWATMQRLRDEGKIRSIGVSNFSVRRFEEQFFKKTDEAPAVNQIERHPYWTREDLIGYCRQRGIQAEAYSPLTRAERMDAPVLAEIAKAHGKMVAQVMIRWQLQQNIVVIPKSTRPERIKENAAVYDFELSKEEMARIDALNEDRSVIEYRPESDWY